MPLSRNDDDVKAHVARVEQAIADLAERTDTRYTAAVVDAARQDIEDELRNFDPTQEGGGGSCERCGRQQEPWRSSRLCQACVWDDMGAR